MSARNKVVRGKRSGGGTRRGARLAPLLVVMILVTLACALPGREKPTATLPEATEAPPTATPLPTATPQPLPPALIESLPAQGGELPLKGPITLYFNQAMNRSTVETALSGQLPQMVNFSWVDDQTVALFPAVPLQPDSTVNLTIDAPASSAQGLGLLQPVSLNFRTAGYLTLSQALPLPDTADIDPTSAVVAAFNQPVVPLGAEPGALPVAFTLNPSAEGRGEWINTSTYVFYPEPALAGGVQYTVTPNSSLTSTGGSPLKDAQPWSFSTAMPRLVSVAPGTETPWRLDAKVELTFNQPMDPASVEGLFALLGPGGAPVAGSDSWNDDFTVFTFTPAALLARATNYTISLNGQAQSLSGTPLGEALSAQVVTVSPLAVGATEPANGGMMPNAYSSPWIGFNAPLQQKGLSDLITIAPAVDDINFYWDESSNRLYASGTFFSNTAYSLTISPELKDVWGAALGSPFVFTFRTPPPQANLTVLPWSGTQFLRPQESSLQAQVTNIQNVPMTVGSLSLQEYFLMAGSTGYEMRPSYQSPDERAWQQALNILPDRSQTIQLPLTPDRSLLRPGLYYMRISYSELKGGMVFNLLVVSDVQLTYKVSSSDALVWAVDLRNNAPVANAPVSLFDEDGAVLAQGTTDNQGVFRTSLTPLENPYNVTYAMLGQPGDDFFSLAPSHWTQGVETGEFGYSSRVRAPGLVTYLYTDRPIYRPGHTVYFRAVVRQENNGRYALPTDLPSLPLKIYDGNGLEIADLNLALSAYGTAHGEFTLPDSAQPGEYYISSPDIQYSGLSFKVANYRKPEINLQVSFTPVQTLAGQSLRAQINARYFFDAPAGNVKANWALYAAPTYFYLPGYQVGPEDTGWLMAFDDSFTGYAGYLGEQVQSGEAQTAPDGTLSLELPTEISSSLLRYTLEVTLVDESGQYVSGRASADVNPADFYIGVRPDAWVGRANESSGFSLLVVDWNKQPAGAHNLRAEFSKVVWQRQEPDSREPGFQPKYIPEYTLVGSTDFSTGADGQARLSFTPPGPGTFVLKVHDPLTPAGQGPLTEFTLWVGGPGQAIWPNLPNSRLKLVADKENYKPGDNAQVFIPNPYGREVYALVTFERQLIMQHQVLLIGAEGLQLPIALTDEHAPNIYVSVTLIGSNEQGMPDFRQGYVNLPVEAVAQTLQVKLISQPERTGPGEEVTFDIQVTDATGAPVQGEFSLAVVDLAVLALADPNAPDILPAFYAIQPLGLRTSLSLAAYSQRLVYAQLGRGGGGGADIPAVVRERFPDTAYWNAEIVTGPDGKASVSLQLPDTLTTWQVDLRGITLDSRVGQAQTQIVTTKEVLIRPVTPRFLVIGDRAMMAAIVQNNSAAELKAEVSLFSSGFTLESAAVQVVSVPAGGRARVEWWGVAQDAETANLVFSLKGEDASGKAHQDDSRPASGALPILHYVAPQAFRTSGILDAGGQIMELVSLPHTFVAEGGNLNVELAPSLAASMLSALDVLEHSPYESTEETLSRFLPNLETYRVLQGLGLEDAKMKARLDRTLADGLLRLSARQNFDGGWGWWKNGESDTYITSYVLFGLLRAKAAGVKVNEDQINRGVEYLSSNVDSGALHLGFLSNQSFFPRLAKLVNLAPLPGGGGMPKSYDRAVFQEFVLAQAGAGDLQRTLAIYQSAEIQAQLNPWGKALLALTLNMLSPGSAEATTLLSELQSNTVRSATGVHWEFLPTPEARRAVQYDMHTTLSNSAIVMYALAQRDPGSPLLADAMRYLMAHRLADGGWGSSYTTAWTLMAIAQVIQGTGELGGNFAFSAMLNNIPLAQGQAGSDQLNPVTAQAPVKSLYPNYPNALVIQRDEGQGRLYYTVGLQVNRPVQSIAPLSQGMSISRAFYPLPSECTAPCAAGEEHRALQSAQAGSRVQVRLTLTLPQEAYYLMVEDYIPAGAEILDTSLKTSQIGEGGEAQAVIYDPRDPFSGGWGWWLFNLPLIYDDHITFSAEYLHAGTYELTYTLVLLQPGLYQVLPAHAWQYYFPEVQANSAGVVFEVKE